MVSKSLLAEYVKVAEKAKKKDENSYDEEPLEKPANRLVIGVVDAIHATTSKDFVPKIAIKDHIKRA